MRTLKLFLPGTILLLFVVSCEDQRIGLPVEEISAMKSETPIIGEYGEYILEPQQFVREDEGHTVFEIPLLFDNYECFSEPYFLSIINGDGNGIGAVTSANISVDEVVIFNQSDFNKRVRDLLSNVIINENSILKIELGGKPGSNITASIEGNYKKCYGLYLWNKLGSLEESNFSEVGPNGSVLGNVSFENCQIDNGSYYDQYGEATSFNLTPNDTYDFQSGTIECWIKPNFNLVNGAPQGTGGLGLTFMTNEKGLTLSIVFHPTYKTYASITYYTTDTYARVIAIDNSTSWTSQDLVHIAMVWDLNGFNDDKRISLFINGIETAFTTDPITVPVGDSKYSDLFIGNTNYLDRPAKCIVDNFKIFNYAKTYFSDRFEE